MTKRTRTTSAANEPTIVQFQEGERGFTCETRSSPATPGTMWWWISITGESQRYAAFRAEPGDTEDNLRPRVIAYYEQLLADRARPPEVRGHWSQRRAGAAAATPAAPTTPKAS
jgi:hypothetical protein